MTLKYRGKELNLRPFYTLNSHFVTGVVTTTLQHLDHIRDALQKLERAKLLDQSAYEHFSVFLNMFFVET